MGNVTRVTGKGYQGYGERPQLTETTGPMSVPTGPHTVDENRSNGSAYGADALRLARLRVRFLAILRRKDHGLGHDELGNSGRKGDGFGSDPPPLASRTQRDRLQRLVAVALQCEKSAVGADRRIVRSQTAGSNYG